MRRKNVRLFCLLLVAIFALGSLPLFAYAEGEKTIASPISITYDVKKAFPTVRLTGAEVTRALHKGVTSNYGGSVDGGGWFVDNGTNYTCLVEKTDDFSPRDWKKLDESDEKLDPSKEYYFRFEIENESGCVFNLATPYDVTINGVQADYIVHPQSETSYIDAFIKVGFNETDDVIIDVSCEHSRYAVQKGKSLKINYVVSGTNDGVVWSIENKTSDLTTISSDGTLTVGINETFSYLNIKCASAIDESVYYMVSVNVYDVPVAINSVTVSHSQNIKEVYPGNTTTFSCEVEGNDIHDIVWSIESPVSDAGTYIDSGGTLYIAKEEAATELVIRATSVYDPTKYGDYPIKIGKFRKITGPIEINYNMKVVFTTGMTASEATDLILSESFGLAKYGDDKKLETGWYVDCYYAYTCLVERNASEDPCDWDRLSYIDRGDEKLSLDGEYYIRIEIEDDPSCGYQWDVDNSPEIKVNGIAPDFIHKSTSETGHMDAFVRILIEGQTPPAKTYAVSFNSDGGTEIAVQYVAEGGQAVRPTDPVKEGLEFAGWWFGAELYDFETPVTAPLTLRARYIVKAEANASEGGSVYAQGDAASAAGHVVSEWYEQPFSFGFFSAVADEGYEFAGWHIGSADGENIVSTSESDRYHVGGTDGAQLSFLLDRSGEVFWAVFTKKSGDSQVTETESSGVSDTEQAPVTEETAQGSGEGTKEAETTSGGKDTDDLEETVTNLKKALIGVVIGASVLVAGGVAAAVIFGIKKRKAGKAGAVK